MEGQGKGVACSGKGRYKVAVMHGEPLSCDPGKIFRKSKGREVKGNGMRDGNPAFS